MNFVGRAKKIEDIDLPRAGARIGVGEDPVHALIDVESRGSGFDKQGRPKMLFEPHVFYRNLRGKQRDEAVRQGLAYPKWRRNYPKDSYPRLQKALLINKSAAFKACSWGMSQVLGENYQMIGYATPTAMVTAFMDDEDNHLEGMIEYCLKAGIDDELRILDDPDATMVEKKAACAVIARVYNGPGYKKNAYHTQIFDRWLHWDGVRDTPWTPPPPPDIPTPTVLGSEEHAVDEPPVKPKIPLIVIFITGVFTAIATFWDYLWRLFG